MIQDEWFNVNFSQSWIMWRHGAPLKLVQFEFYEQILCPTNGLPQKLMLNKMPRYHLHFRNVRLEDASNLSMKGLKVLKQHKVVHLEVNGLKITINDLIACLGDWSLRNLRSLNVANSSFTDCSRSFNFPQSSSACHPLTSWYSN